MSKHNCWSNKYASLLDGSESEIDVLVQRLHLSPKALIAFKKAREPGKAAKGCKASVGGVRVHGWLRQPPHRGVCRDDRVGRKTTLSRPNGPRVRSRRAENLPA